MINHTLATPSALRQVSDMEMFWRFTLLMLLQCSDLRLISVWHPSYLSLLVQRLRKNWASLLQDLESGLTLTGPALQISANPSLAHNLAKLGCDDLHLIWRKLRLISCWADGHAAAFIPQLEALFPEASIQAKGLIATEAFVTVSLGKLRPLAIRSHIFEFLDDNDRAYTPWSIEKGGIYSVVVTTGGGLYRYRLGDKVEVVAFYRDVPCLQFLGKENQVSDYYGEKLNESFVATVLGKLFAQFGLCPRFALLAIEESMPTPAYVLYVDIEKGVPDSFEQQLDRELRDNPHYDLCIRLGQLGTAQIAKVRSNAFQIYADRLSELGVRIGDIKPTPLSRYGGWNRYFNVIC